METVTLTIDDRPVSVPQGTSLLNAAEQYNIKIPTLCHHPDLEPFGSCRLCLVEDEKTGRLFASCVTPAAPDMVIRTDTPRINNHRKNIIRLMISEHPESCIVCSKGNRCRLRMIAAQLGIGETELYSMPNPRNLEEANPFIIRDLTKCILCGKCIRADHELVCVGAIDYNLRGFHSRPTTVHDQGLERSTCTFCGTCVSLCPTGALSQKQKRYVGTPDREAVSVCGFCGVGCSLSMGIVGKTIVEVNPSHRQDTVNRATLCVRGHFAHDFLASPNRLSAPLHKNDEGEPVPASWVDAMDIVSRRLLAIKQTFGSQSIGFLGSSKCTNEENYLFQKIARVVFKTNNIDNRSYFSGQHSHPRWIRQTGGGPRPLSRLEQAEAIIVLGSDPGHSTPVVSYYLKRAFKKGIPIVVIDPRQTELVSHSTLWLDLRPQSDLELINALSASLLKETSHGDASTDKNPPGFDSFRKALATHDVDRAATLTGIEPMDIHRAVALMDGRKLSVVVGHGILQQPQRGKVLAALYNLLLLTGSIGSDMAGFYMVVSENNQIGAWDMGSAPHILPGPNYLADDGARGYWEQVWQNKISPDQGLNAARMVEEAEKGNLKALYILGENPLRSFPQPERVRAALESLEFLVVQDILLTETAAMADVVLAGTPFSEKSGSFTNLEGRIQSFQAVVPPLADTKPDWEILDMLAAGAGYPKRYETIESLQEEIRINVPAYKHMATDGGAWVDGEPESEGYAFAPVERLPDLTHDRAFPMTAILGTSRNHLGSGTRTGESERIREYAPACHIHIAKADADKLGIENHQRINVVSRWGAVERSVAISDDLGEGLLFIPTASNGNDAMNLIGLTDADSPEFTGWKTVPVWIEANGS